MTLLSMENPVFRAYALAAVAMIMKMAGHSWFTAYRMAKAKAGFRNPEDTRRTILNPNPSPDQLLPNEYVERTRRMSQNETESVPLSLAVGLLWVTTSPSLGRAQWVFGAYVVSRLAHFVVMAERTHEERATVWAVGSLLIFYMAGSTAWHALTM